ncbi:hypothetical protein DPMN_026049 [Dreissena polymorpha]|uniref:Uncharacterized protein n=1 Tax=Dreissena polymorpha TaxID=45954 RepID=A0A9D4RC77_DREPO|nr:hypothetical protein DPMN_026049 [Dreissena polymorpha]
MGRLFNEPKDKADILNRQYESVFTQENQEHVSCPPGTTLSSMSEICVTKEDVEKLLRKTNSVKALGPECISGRILKECYVQLNWLQS